MNFLRNFSKILRNYQMNSSTLANELINIFGNASIGTAVNDIVRYSYLMYPFGIELSRYTL